MGLAVETSNPSYLFVHPTKKYLYAVAEQANGQINAFEINSKQTGKLKLLNTQSSRGGSPCYLSSNHAGEYLLVANYQDGAVAILPIDQKNGQLKSFSGFDQQIGSSVNPSRQQSSHAHCMLLDKKEENLLSANLGSDEIYTYRFDSKKGSFARLSHHKIAKAGDGPRHLVFNSNQKYIFVTNELSSTIAVYQYSSDLKPVSRISTVPANWTGENYPAEIRFHPTREEYLYASNRGHDSIAVFLVNHQTGNLKLIQHINVQGRAPRHFNITPNGKHLIVANLDSNNLLVFSIDLGTGKLTATGSKAQVSKPTCVQYLL